MLNRRILCLGTASVLGGSILKPQPVYGQVAETAISILRKDLSFILSPDARFVPDPTFADNFMTVELGARQRFFSSIADASEDDVRSILDPVSAQLLGIESAEDIRLVSRVTDYIEGLKRNADQTVPEQEHPLEIVLLIVIESLGFEFMKEAVVDVITNETVPRKLANNLTDNLEFRDVSGAIENLITLVSYFLSSNGLLQLGKRLVGLSTRQIRNKILIALGARLFPFVGQAFTAAGFTTCVYVYRERLVAAFTR